tara:strand:- start:109 stop:393 length:285 start_codon:yes stop_codon:yes gene_type:complete
MKANNNYTKTEYVVNGLRITDLRLVGDYIELNNLTEINSFVNINGVKTEVIAPSTTVTEPYNNLDMDDFNEDGTIKTDVLNGINNNTPNTFIKA